MATYVMLVTLTEKGAQDLQGIAERRPKQLEQLERHGIKIVADFALMGEYDFLYVVEAPDNLAMMQQIMKDSTSGTVRFRTMPAFPMDQFADMAKQM